MAYAKELLMTPICNMYDLMHKLVDKLMGRLPHYRWLRTNAKELEPLVQHTVTAVLKGQPGTREFANVAYGAAGIWKSVGVATVRQQEKQLFKVLARMVEWWPDKFSAQGLANTA